MKRLNLETGKPFVRGDTRADGFLFYKYGVRIKTDGYLSEIWLTPDAFDNTKLSNKKWCAKNRLSITGRAASLIDSAIRRCNQRKVGKVTITKEWLEEILRANVCQLTGLPFDMNPPKKTTLNPYSPSLDRIDNNNPDYTTENTRVVLSAVNIAINDYGLDVLLPIMKALVDNQST